jgi:hypothetical protein
MLETSEGGKDRTYQEKEAERGGKKTKVKGQKVKRQESKRKIQKADFHFRKNNSLLLIFDF